MNIVLDFSCRNTVLFSVITPGDGKDLKASADNTMYWKIPFSHTCWQIFIYIWCHDKVSFADRKESILTEIFRITCSTWMQPEWGSIRIILLLWYWGPWFPHGFQQKPLLSEEPLLLGSKALFALVAMGFYPKQVAGSWLQWWEVRLPRVSRPAAFSFAALLLSLRDLEVLKQLLYTINYIISLSENQKHMRHNCNIWPLSKGRAVNMNLWEMRK